MSITKRTIVLLIAVLFLVTSVAFSVMVVMEMMQDDSAQDTATSENAPAPQDQLQEQIEEQTLACDIRQSVTAEAETVPEAFKPDGDVTELKTTDIVEGDGETIATGDCLVVKYHGTLASDGSKFDGNYDQPTALQFNVGTGTVIPGWDQGLEGMKVGGTRRIIIPSELGYGANGAGSIPPNADLVFVVKLLEIKDETQVEGE